MGVARRLLGPHGTLPCVLMLQYYVHNYIRAVIISYFNSIAITIWSIPLNNAQNCLFIVYLYDFQFSNLLKLHNISLVCLHPLILAYLTAASSIGLNTNGKAYINCYFDASICCTTQPASVLLYCMCWDSCCWRGCQGWEGGISYLWKHTPYAYKL